MLSIRIAEVAGECIPCSNTEEEKIRRHWLIILIRNSIAGIVIACTGP